MTNEYKIIEKFLHVPYDQNGKDLSTGMNCWELSKAVLREAGKPIQDIVDFMEECPADDLSRVLSAYSDQGTKIPIPDPFDLVLFEFEGLLHAGVVLSKRRFIHTCRSGTGVCRLDSDLWKRKIIGFYRVRDHA